MMSSRPAPVRKAVGVSLSAFVACFVVGLFVCSPLLAAGGYACTVLALAANTVLSFAVPGLIMRYYAVGGAMAFAGGGGSVALFGLSAVLSVVCQPLVGWAAHLDWFIDTSLGLSGPISQASKELLASVCDFSDVWHWAATLVAVALLPALCEELFFRAGLLPLLRRLTGGWRSAIVISAIIFSAVHMDPAGFLSRTILGILLGFIFVETRSLWASATFHFLNNAMCVISIAVAESPLDALTAEPAAPTFFETIFSLALTVYILVVLSKLARGKNER